MLAIGVGSFTHNPLCSASSRPAWQSEQSCDKSESRVLSSHVDSRTTCWLPLPAPADLAGQAVNRLYMPVTLSMTARMFSLDANTFALRSSEAVAEAGCESAVV